MTLNVIDIASYQADLNPSSVATDAVIIKATEGTGYVNLTWRAQADQTLAAGKKLGLYHFINGMNGAAQADFFLGQVSGYVGKAILVLDFENTSDSNVRNQQGVNAGLDFLNHIFDKTGVRPLVYTNTDFEQNLNWSAVVAGNYGLWIAQYDTDDPIYGFQPRPYRYELKNWADLAMFQYSSTTVVPGYSKGIDVSIFYGDGGAWDAYAKASKQPAPDPAPAPSPSPSPVPADSWTDDLGVTWYKEEGTATLTTAVKLRWGATTSSSVIAVLPSGSVIKYDAKAVSGGFIWLRQPRSGGYGYFAGGEVNGTGQNINPYATFR